jgi:hypothetical protein
MITCKENVRLKELSSELLHIFNVLYSLNQEKIPNYPIDWLITSMNDSKHKVGSKHYLNKALDLRSKSFSSTIIKNEFRDRLEYALGEDYTVFIEDIDTLNEHFHIQLRKGL